MNAHLHLPHLHHRTGEADDVPRGDRVAILMVCLGNICRSPMAEGVLRHLADERGLGHHVLVDSAGTAGYHVGEPPDPRAIHHAGLRGVDISGLRGRRFEVHDFEWFDLVLPMDAANEAELRRRARRPEQAHEVHRLRTFDPAAGRHLDVEDPYTGDGGAFEAALDAIWPACEGLLDHLVERNGW